ncbi:MAG: PadR family transcriptional regulator [Candidatus Bathyarchaeia archaeon]
MSNIRNIQVKLMKGLLDLIVLQLLRSKPMHGYQIITSIRRTFGVYFGPSTIYPLLNDLEKSGYVTSEWDMSRERPRKVYRLTHEGRSLLNFAEESLSIICRKIGVAENLRMNHKEDERCSATFLNIVREKSS